MYEFTIKCETWHTANALCLNWRQWRHGSSKQNRCTYAHRLNALHTHKMCIILNLLFNVIYCKHLISFCSSGVLFFCVCAHLNFFPFLDSEVLHRSQTNTSTKLIVVARRTSETKKPPSKWVLFLFCWFLSSLGWFALHQRLNTT